MIEQERDAARPPELSDESVTSVRVIYPDLHGVVRGKDVPIGEFGRAMDHGLAFCSAVMSTDLRHTPVVGGEEGYPDLVAYPDLSTMTLVPWEPGLACCIADLHPVEGDPTPPPDPRGAVRRAVGELRGDRAGTGRRSGARVLPLRAGRRGAQRGAPLRGQPEHGLHRRAAGRSARRGAPDRGVVVRARDGHVRVQPRVHELAVRDQPSPRGRPDRGRPRLPSKGRRQGRSGDTRPGGYVHGQAVQRPGRIGLPLPLLARPRRQQRLRRRRGR